MQSDYSIVPARAEMAAEIAGIERLCFSEPWTQGFIARALDDPLNVFFAAPDGSGAVLGYIGMARVLDEGYIHNVAVRPDSRRLGIGEALVKRMLAYGAKAGMSFITLEVRESNAPARSLYSKLGFVSVGRRKNYYTHPSEDALLMSVFFPRNERNVI